MLRLPDNYYMRRADTGICSYTALPGSFVIVNPHRVYPLKGAATMPRRKMGLLDVVVDLLFLDYAHARFEAGITHSDTVKGRRYPARVREQSKQAKK
jgi:hypothetical protein